MTPAEKPPENPAPAPGEAVFTLKRAAEVAGVSPSTLRRNKETLREHGANISEHGWKVPMSALIASGLMRRTTPPDQPAPAPQAVHAAAEDQTPDRVRELEREALELRRRAEVAEAVARERGEALEDMRTAMRMLTAGPAATSASETASPAPDGPPEPPKPEKPVQEPQEPAMAGRWRRAWRELRANRQP